MFRNLKLKSRLEISNYILGILLMLTHALAMAMLYTLTKSLTQSLHTHQVTFLYKFAILLAILPWCAKGGFKKNIKTKKLWMHLTRGTFSIMGSLCFFNALAHVNVLDAAAVSYTENILIVLIGVLYFKEQFNINKFLFISISFVGALLITKPGIAPFNKYYIFIFLALIFWAINNFAIKVLGKTEHTRTQLFYVMSISSLLSFPLALQEWRPLEIWHYKFIAGLACCYLIHVVAFFKAFKHAEISVVMPFDYSRLIFTGILGYCAFNELPKDALSYAGYSLIVIGGLYFMHYEAIKLRRKHKKT